MKLTERRLHLLGWLLTLTGLGSMLFHGTLKWWAQWMDEVPMMIGNFIVIFALLEDQATRKYKYLAHFLAMMVVATLVIYALFPQYFEIFFFIYTGFLFVALLLFFRVYTNSECPKTFRYLLHCTLFFLGGGFVLWILENLYCHSAPPPVENLHAIWHVMSGTGVFCGVEAFVLLRAKALGREYNVSRMAYTGIPIVVVEPVKAE